PLLREQITLSAEQGSNFVAHELSALSSFFAIDSITAPKPVKPGMPGVFATFEGSLNHLNAKLQFLYGKRMITIGASPASENFVYETTEGRASRNTQFEKRCGEEI